jgi:hypothetical protein
MQSMSKKEFPSIQEFQEQLGLKASEFQSLIAGGWQGIQSTISGIELRLPKAKPAERKSLLQTISVLTLLILFLASCTTVDAGVTETPVHGDTGPTVTLVAPTPDNGTDVIAPTIVVPPPTETAAPTVEVDYFDMSPEERLAESERLAEQANAYDGEISFNITSRTEKAPDFDCPVYWNDGLGQWNAVDTCSAGGVPEADLDIYGDTLPELAASGWENNDGSLVFVHPQTGEEITFPGTVTVPGIGEISMRDLMAMGPDELNSIMSEFTAAAILERTGDPELRLLKMQETMAVRGTAYPGFVIESSRLFPLMGAGGGHDFPELGVDAFEQIADLVAMPIFSPETGDFMFWFTVQKGVAASVLHFEDTDYDFVRFGMDGETIGTNGSSFGIFMEYDGDDQGISYSRGGGGSRLIGFDGDDPGMGDVDLINQVLNASSEEEILSLLDDVGITFTYPSVVVFEPGQ